jgi:hypothetical protein
VEVHEMRKGFVISLAIVSFGLGAWLSPRAGAQTRETNLLPENPKSGQRITVSVPESTTCEVARQDRHWVQCKGGMWFNLQTGAAYLLVR